MEACSIIVDIYISKSARLERARVREGRRFGKAVDTDRNGQQQLISYSSYIFPISAPVIGHLWSTR